MQQDSIDLVDILSLIYWLIAVLTISKQGTLLTGATSITLYAAVLHTRECHVLFQFTPSHYLLIQQLNRPPLQPLLLPAVWLKPLA